MLVSNATAGILIGKGGTTLKDLLVFAVQASNVQDVYPIQAAQPFLLKGGCMAFASHTSSVLLHIRFHRAVSVELGWCIGGRALMACSLHSCEQCWLCCLRGGNGNLQLVSCCE